MTYFDIFRRPDFVQHRMRPAGTSLRRMAIAGATPTSVVDVTPVAGLLAVDVTVGGERPLDRIHLRWRLSVPGGLASGDAWSPVTAI